MILCLDPSSTVTGWAWMRPPQDIIEAGLIKPASDGANALDRIRSIVADVRELLDTLDPEQIVIEVTSGHVGTNRHAGNGAGLAVYGMAVGAVWEACHRWAGEHLCPSAPAHRVHCIYENAWTRKVPKWKRSAAIAAMFPQYDPAADPGGDMADAIGLGCWFLRERAVVNMQKDPD